MAAIARGKSNHPPTSHHETLVPWDRLTRLATPTHPTRLKDPGRV